MNLDIKNLENVIDKTKIRYNEPMHKHTTLKVGGSADALVLPEKVEEILNVLRFAKENSINVTVIGNGSKLLVLDSGIRGIVIKLGNKFSSYKIENDEIEVCAGASLPYIAVVAKNSSLSGLEFAAGIPGNIGGAIYMNAGAYNREMACIVKEVTYIDDNLEVKTISNDECKFGYRSSFFKLNKDKGYVILSAKLKLSKGNKEEIESLMKQNNDLRSQKQPLEYPNAGSTFKRPEGYFVGKLIDDIKLKGYTIGGAQVSTKHSGFIVNKGNATAKDVIDLINYIKKEVLKNYGINLEEEIIILGEGD